MQKDIYKFVHFNSVAKTSRLIKLDMKSNNIPHCCPNKQLPEYKLEFNCNKRDYDIYLDSQSMFDIFITCINNVKSTEDDKDVFIVNENKVYPEERWCFKSHNSQNKLFQLFYNTPYTLKCNMLISKEFINDKPTGRINLSVQFIYKIFFLNFNLHEKPIEVNLSSEQIMSLQTEIYKEFSNED